MDEPKDIRTLPTDNDPVTPEEDYILKTIFSPPDDTPTSSNDFVHSLKGYVPNIRVIIGSVLIAMIIHPICLTAVITHLFPNLKYEYILIIKMLLIFIVLYLVFQVFA